MRNLTIIVASVIVSGLVSVGCGDAKPAKSADEARDTKMSTPVAQAKDSAAKNDGDRVTQAVTKLLGLDAEILRVCNLHFNAAPTDEGAPRFDTDESQLSSEDSSILAQVATCLTTGPLAGRHVKLVGRADSRGMNEYNMVLGEHRASTVGQYLEKQGVQLTRINSTSRGELDATGTDETSMRDDRRVDILLGT
jgi:peptidoglycan-associated lipoprotein